VAAVNGAAVAGGFDLAVMCDLRVLADVAVFAHPEVKFGDVV
jgi:enoyl-CoA hydratase